LALAPWHPPVTRQSIIGKSLPLSAKSEWLGST
jgi:hypothetical protein